MTNGIDFSGISLPFSVNDLISSTSGLLGLVGGFVLLGLAVAFAPKIIGLIKKSANSNNKG